MFTFLYLFSNLVGYFIGFNFVLKKLKVSEQRLKRAIYLSLLLLAIQMVSSTICELVALDDLAALLLTIILFLAVIRKFLVLTLWQTILIPVIVPIIGQLCFVIVLGLSIKLFGPITV
ncbi:hypothetical protein [Pseudoalteromonas byunsanensis]|uniref:Uncharacterized protein n=1 Tax=Pseudoalteromonas byunsanensis TaxID=327939 RepID=A0A1S1N6H8_9GAMM|nr:hypothetical protein [Pseudoalteromonas byunsanensis]OHU94963.1 hypothetical protein BIW53_13175 [Pseudoalteromonas byunsanensis]